MFRKWFRTPTIRVPTITRSIEQQAAVDTATADLALYCSDGCMFCSRVRKAIRALGLHIEIRDICSVQEHYRDLLIYGGRPTVPCLRVGKDIKPTDARWMYESRDIIAYLQDRFGDSS